jgi:hypothetical protein
MSGPLLLLGALVLALAGWLLLRRAGDGWRIGRLLAAAPLRSLAEAQAMAARGDQAYVRLHGRIDSADVFPGEDGKPLVFQRRRLQRWVSHPVRGSRWLTFDDARLAVPFGLVERDHRVAIDIEALGDGLVVVPRVAHGVAADLAPGQGDAPVDAGADAPADAEVDGPEAALAGARPPGLDDDTPVALRIEQVSATDHASACGVPRVDETGATLLGPGLRRPLILTTLEPEEAMRVLGAHQRRSLLAAGGLLIAASLMAVAGLITTLLDRGGPDFAGSPLGVLLGVVGLGLATALVTAALVRWGQR